MRDYKKFEVWSKAHQLYLHIKRDVIVKFPKEEKYELASQLQRATLSVQLNEADYCCFAASELNYISMGEYGVVNKLINETRAMLIAFIKFLRR